MKAVLQSSEFWGALDAVITYSPFHTDLLLLNIKMVLVFSTSKISDLVWYHTVEVHLDLILRTGQACCSCTLLSVGQGPTAPSAVLRLMALYKFLFFESVPWPLNHTCSKVVSPLVVLINPAHNPWESITYRIQTTTSCSSSALWLSASHVCSHLAWLSLDNLAESQLEMVGLRIAMMLKP